MWVSSSFCEINDANAEIPKKRLLGRVEKMTKDEDRVVTTSSPTVLFPRALSLALFLISIKSLQSRDQVTSQVLQILLDWNKDEALLSCLSQ